MSPQVVAAIDCGTNSTRLLVAAKGADGRLATLERLMTITRLGEGVDAKGVLADAAMDIADDRLAHAHRLEHGSAERFGLCR